MRFVRENCIISGLRFGEYGTNLIMLRNRHNVGELPKGTIITGLTFDGVEVNDFSRFGDVSLSKRGQLEKVRGIYRNHSMIV